MDTQTPRPWYKKKRYIIPLAGVIGIVGLANLSGNTTPTAVENSQATNLQPQQVIPVVVPTTQKEIAPAQSTKTESAIKTSNTSSLSNGNYYNNVDGSEVHSPAYSENVPAGASAQCQDGTYSFSQHRQGTCSHHGGVAEWL